jgi:hypothetical protein
MADFEQSRAAFAQASADRDRNGDALLLAREGVQRGKRDAPGRVKELEQRGARLKEVADASWREFEAFTDPKQSLRHLPDRNPILLFPLRIETRFKRSARGVNELWVRVYPDQCLAESFEESLTEQEARNAQTFWAGIWRARVDRQAPRADQRRRPASARRRRRRAARRDGGRGATRGSRGVLGKGVARRR